MVGPRLGYRRCFTVIAASVDTVLGRRANGGVAVGGVRAVRRPAAPAKNDARALRAPAPAAAPSPRDYGRIEYGGLPVER